MKMLIWFYIRRGKTNACWFYCIYNSNISNYNDSLQNDVKLHTCIGNRVKQLYSISIVINTYPTENTANKKANFYLGLHNPYLISGAISAKISHLNELLLGVGCSNYFLTGWTARSLFANRGPFLRVFFPLNTADFYIFSKFRWNGTPFWGFFD